MFKHLGQNEKKLLVFFINLSNDVVFEIKKK